MLDSLYIKNFRNLKEFRIGSVDRINLITGKNNTGKSSILEAIAIYASQADFSLIFQLLNHRGEDFFRKNYNSTDSKDTTEFAIRSLSAMFTGRNVNFSDEGTIFIGNITENKIFPEKNIFLRFVKYYDEIQKNEQGETLRRKIAYINKEEIFDNSKIGMEVGFGDEKILIPLDRERPYRLGFGGFNNRKKFQFIRTATIDRETNGKLFDNIALSEKENMSLML